MPYRLKKKGSQVCVVKESGEEIHCHGTRAQAIKQLQSLYASENKELSKEAIDDLADLYEDEVDDVILKELNELEPLVKAVWTATANLPDSAFLFIEHDGDKKIRHLPVRNKEGHLDAGHVRNAIARANQIKLKDGSKISAAKAEELKTKARKLLEEVNKEIKPESQFSVFKSTDNIWHWQGCYSNTKTDRARPSDQITAAAHRTFAYMVKEGIVSPPPLLAWHIDGFSPAITDRVWFDEDTNEAWAEGTFRVGFEAQAEWLSKQTDTKMSHRMPIALLNREPADLTQPGIIKSYVSNELTYLPAYAAAVEETQFGVSKESAMLTDEKKEYLRKQGVKEDQIVLLEALNKETVEPAIEKQNQAEIVETPTQTETETVSPEVVALRKDLDEVIEALKAIPDFIAQGQAQIKTLAETVQAQNEIVTALKKADDDKVKSLLEGTSTAARSSLKDFIIHRLDGNPEALIDGRTTLAKDKPVETSPAGNDIISTIIHGDWHTMVPNKFGES